MNRQNVLMYAGIAIALLLTATIFVTPLGITGSFKALQEAEAVEHAAEFDVTDKPGPWFENVDGGGSLAIVEPGDTVRFTIGGSTNTVHTVTTLLWPSSIEDDPSVADDFPYDSGAFKGDSVDIILPDPGLYVIVCKLHPFMLAAVVADDPATTAPDSGDPGTDPDPRLDLGEDITLVMGGEVPTASDLALRLVRGFFVITNPSNWQVFGDPGATWDPSYPPVAVRAYDKDNNQVDIDNLDTFLGGYFSEPVLLPAVSDPITPGVGEVWVDTQYELTEGKSKPGTATAVDVQSWDVKRKVALPEINLNNPHNMWTDEKQKLIYQTQWFDNKLTTFDRTTGKLRANTVVGEAPAHVMTRVDTDTVHVSINGGDTVAELNANGKKVLRQIPIADLGVDDHPLPHAHWMSHDGKTMVTPNANTADSTIYSFEDDTFVKVDVGDLPIATGLMPDASKYYVSNFLDSSIHVIDTATGAEIDEINLLANYDNPDRLRCGVAPPPCASVTGPFGALPIQTPVSPNGKYVVTANTLSNTITIIDTDTDELIKSLPCDAGCHGVNFGAKQGGGYYAYVSSKFANTLIVVDIDPNNNGEANDAVIAGRIVLDATADTKTDDTIVDDDDYKGMGGQGVLPIPLVYNGWVQELPTPWKKKLTEDQLNPLG